MKPDSWGPGQGEGEGQGPRGHRARAQQPAAMSKPCPHRIPPCTGITLRRTAHNFPAVSGPVSGTPPASGGGQKRQLLARPSRHTHPAAQEPRNKHLIWVRFNTQVNSPAPPHPASAQPAPPQPLSQLGLLAGKVGWDPSALTFCACKELHPLQRQRSKIAGGQALGAPEGRSLSAVSWQPGGGGGSLCPQGRV